MIEVSMNKNPADWEKENDGTEIRILFQNCRSMKNKFAHIASDKCLQMGEIIILTETWLDREQTADEYNIPGYNLNLNSVGRGRGIATYYKQNYNHATNVNYDGFSITKIESEKLDIIGIYRSQEGSVTTLIMQLENLIIDGKTTIIGGDVNICTLANPKNYVTQSLKEIGFNQIVRKATHTEGGLLDHIYIIQGHKRKFSYSVENFSKYYSDHDGIGLILSEVEE